MKKTHKKYILSFLVIISILLFSVGCSDMMEKLGQISLTIELDIPEITVESYTLEGSLANTDISFVLDDVTALNHTLTSLRPGQWTIRVTAFDSNGNQIGAGTKVTDLIHGQILDTTLLVVFGQAAPDELTPSSPSRYDSNEGKITGTTLKMEYKLSSAGEESYAACLAGETLLAPGTYHVRFAAAHGLDPSSFLTITVPEYQPVQLAVSGTTITPSKVYDGSTAATVTAAGALNGIISGDTVTVSATATYDDKSAGTGKHITISYTLGGIDAGNYLKPVDNSSFTGEITKKSLSVSGTVLESSKEYDGDTSVSVTANGNLAGVLSGDTVTVLATATYDNNSAATGKTITVGYTLGGTDAGNYIKPVDNSSFAGGITKKPLSASGTVLENSKEYDGNASVSVTAHGNLAGVLSGDTVTVLATATYQDETVGTDKSINVHYTLAGVHAANYVEPEDNTTFTGEITRKRLTVSTTNLTTSKVYDGNETASISAVDFSGKVSTEDVVVSATAAYDDKSAGIGKTITVGYTLSGADKDNYLKPVDSIATGIIGKKQLTVSDTSINPTKVYDGSTIAAVTSDGTLIGVCFGDTVTVSATATYDDKSATTGKNITVSFTVSGTDVDNYQKPVDNSSFSGEITKKSLSVSGTVLESSKEYDGDTSVSVTSNGSLAGVLAGDTVTVVAAATYDSSAAGENKATTVSYTLSGIDAGNYSVNNDTSKIASITKAVLTATVENYSKTYGAANPAFTVAVAGFVNGESTANASGYSAPTASSAATTTTGVGTSSITITGGSATNYSFNTTDTGTLTINKAVLTATVENYSKTYGAANPAFTVAVAGFVNGESTANASGYSAPTASSAATTTTGVGTSSITITGGSATNYSFNTTDTGTLTINKAVLTATVGDYSKTYGAANPSFAVSVAGFVNGESTANASGYSAPTASSAATTTTGVGTSAITIAGGSATNYSFNTTDTGTLTINKAVLTATVGDYSKTYGAANPAFTVAVAGFVNGESTANASGYSAPTASSAATTTTGVGTSAITIAGGSATNYSFDTTDTGTLTINKATMAGSVSISGIAQKDEVLTAVPSLTNTGTPTYQWKRGGTAISGATGTTYTSVSADIGFTITVTATASGANYQGSITSPAVGPVQKPAGPSMSDTITGYFPASPASPTIVNFTGFTTNLTNIEASVALNGSTYGNYADIEVDSRNRAMLVPASNVTTATKVRLRVKETTTLAAGPAQEIALTAQSLAIGDYYQGGVVAYFFVSWDPGYQAGQVHGLIAAKSDVSSTKIAWSYSTTTVVGTDAGIGKGLVNTNKIVTSLGGSAASYAAGMTRAYTGGGYTDWFLPSKDELYKMRISYDLIGNFATAAASFYWSSTEEQGFTRTPTPYTGDTVHALEFTPNTNNSILVLQSWKTDNHLVRAVRYF